MAENAYIVANMFPYTDKENEWLSTAKSDPKKKTRKSNLNRHRQVTEPQITEWTKVGHYWYVPYNRFKI